jgi:CheY-like chemotaxis protein
MHPLSILLVENHEESAQPLTRLLGREGHQVTTASSAADAVIAAAGMGPIDVLISDISLRDSNGCKLLRTLAERKAGAPRYAIALTGHGDSHWVEECRRAGFGSFLLKPVMFDHLLHAIAAAIADDPPAAAILAAGNARSPSDGWQDGRDG